MMCDVMMCDMCMICYDVMCVCYDMMIIYRYINNDMMIYIYDML